MPLPCCRAVVTSLGFWGAAYFPGDDGTIAGLLPTILSSMGYKTLRTDLIFVAPLASGLISLIFPVILIGFLMVATVVGTAWAPATQGKSLEDIETERYGAPVTNATR